MLFGLAIFIFITFVLSLSIAWLASKFLGNEEDGIVNKINDLLPQTQCGQCNYPGCKPYAEAIVNNEASINQCPPGGQEGVDALASLLNIESMPLNAEHGEIIEETHVVEIIESQCIGCTLCIKACPVDAIIGSAKNMHTVIASECTGCNLCIEPCPVDCIVIKKTKKKTSEWVMPIPKKLPQRNHANR